MIFCDINRFCVAKFKWRADVNNIRGIGAPCCFHPFVNRKDFAFTGGRRQIKENQLGGKPWLNVARIHALLILNFIIPNFIHYLETVYGKVLSIASHKLAVTYTHVLHL